MTRSATARCRSAGKIIGYLGVVVTLTSGVTQHAAASATADSASTDSTITAAALAGPNGKVAPPEPTATNSGNAIVRPVGANYRVNTEEPTTTNGTTVDAQRRHVKANTVAPEPSGYWTGPINSPVPLTITGGTVIRSARQLRTLLRQGGAVIVDVSNAPRRPENLAPGAPWLPLPHRAIPGSLWIPGVGLSAIPVSVDDFYRQKLAAATGDHLARPLVIYCHESCWLSWNAAKRAISYGYRKVYWFREGVEGWKAAGYRTAVIEPQVAPEG